MNTMKINELETDVPPFDRLFSLTNKEYNVETYSRIKLNMELLQFDSTQPIIVWEKDGRKIVIDGHTRIKAALENGIKEVPVVEKNFLNEDDAVEYAIHLQRDRRKLSDSDILNFVMLLEERVKKVGRPAKTALDKAISSHFRTAVNGKVIVKVEKSLELAKVNQHLSTDEWCKDVYARRLLFKKKKFARSSDIIGDFIGVDRNKIEKCRYILKKNDKETIESVLAGATTINAAYNKLNHDNDNGNGHISRRLKFKDILIQVTMPEDKKFAVERTKWVVFGKTDKPPKKLPKGLRFYLMEKTD